MASDDPNNPIITSTAKELGFAAWQESRGASSLDQSGASWELFSAWFDCGKFASLRDVVCRAWNEAQAMRRDAWWKQIVESQPSVTSG
jgi:hypothetical protein